MCSLRYVDGDVAIVDFLDSEMARREMVLQDVFDLYIVSEGFRPCDSQTQSCTGIGWPSEDRVSPLDRCHKDSRSWLEEVMQVIFDVNVGL